VKRPTSCASLLCQATLPHSFHTLDRQICASLCAHAFYATHMHIRTVPGCGTVFNSHPLPQPGSSQRRACSPGDRISSQTCTSASDAAHRRSVSTAAAVCPPARTSPGLITHLWALSWPWRPAQPGTRPRGARARTGCTRAGRRRAAARPCRSIRAAGTCTCARVRARQFSGSALSQGAEGHLSATRHHGKVARCACEPCPKKPARDQLNQGAPWGAEASLRANGSRG